MFSAQKLLFLYFFLHYFLARLAHIWLGCAVSFFLFLLEFLCLFQAQALLVIFFFKVFFYGAIVAMAWHHTTFWRDGWRESSTLHVISLTTHTVFLKRLDSLARFF